MNSKAISLALVALVAASCMVATVMYDSDGEPITGDNVVPIGSLSFTAEEKAEVTLLVNDYAYIGGDYQIAWSATTLTGTQPGEWGDAVLGDADRFPSSGDNNLNGIDGLTLTISRNDDSDEDGSYTLSLSSNTAGTYNGVIKSVITVNVNGTTMDLDTVYYTFSANVTTSSEPVMDLATPDSMEFTYGSRANQSLTFEESTGKGYVPNDVTALTWYAVGLPAGLAMTADGRVSGMPLETTEEDGASVQIYARNATGQTYSGTLTVTVNPQTVTPSGIDYEVTGATPAGTATYIAEQNAEVTLTVTPTGTPSSVTVYAIDGDGRSDLRNNGNEGNYVYSVPTAGTGAYTVEITVDDDTVTFVLYVFATPESDVQAEIHVSTISP